MILLHYRYISTHFNRHYTVTFNNTTQYNKHLSCVSSDFWKKTTVVYKSCYTCTAIQLYCIYIYKTVFWGALTLNHSSSSRDRKFEIHLFYFGIQSNHHHQFPCYSRPLYLVMHKFWMQVYKYFAYPRRRLVVKFDKYRPLQGCFIFSLFCLSISLESRATQSKWVKEFENVITK